MGGFFYGNIDSIGTLIAYKLIQLFEIKMIDFSYTLLIPGVIIILTGIIQKKIVDIPLLEGLGKITE